MPNNSVHRPAAERVHPPHRLIKIVNPVARWMLVRGRPARVADQIVLLHFTGRRSGREYAVPAGCRRIRGRLGVLTNSGWRVNFRGGRDFEVTLKGVRRPARGELMDGPAEVVEVYRELLDDIGWENVQRELGIRINVDRPPTNAELRTMIDESGLSILWIELQDTTDGVEQDESEQAPARH